jgi:hypothetical protein
LPLLLPHPVLLLLLAGFAGTAVLPCQHCHLSQLLPAAGSLLSRAAGLQHCWQQQQQQQQQQH